MYLRDSGDRWIGMILLPYGDVFEIQGQTHRMQVKDANVDDIAGRRWLISRSA